MKSYTLEESSCFDLKCKKIHYLGNEEYKDLEEVTTIIVEHTKTLNTIEKVFQYFRKKSETSIGYHFMIGKNGQIYLSRPLDAQGTFSVDILNSQSIGIAVFGNLHKHPPTEKQIETLKKLLPLVKKYFKAKTVKTHNLAIYDLLKKHSNLPLPEVNSITFQNDLAYYSFLKQTNKTIREQQNDKLTELFNSMKPSHGIYLQKELEKMK